MVSPPDRRTVKPLSFALRERQTLAIIGETVPANPTLAKMLAGMIEPTSGGYKVTIIPHYRRLLFVSKPAYSNDFQDPSTASLNPHVNVFRRSLTSPAP